MSTFLVPKNKATGYLLNAITDTTTTELTVKSGQGVLFPNTYPYHIVVSNLEIMNVSNRSTDVFTVERGSESTSPVTHRVNAKVSLNVTAQYISELQTAINNSESEILYPNINVKTGNYNVTTDDYTVLGDSSAINLVFTLPTTSGNDGKLYNFKKIDDSSHTVNIVTFDTTQTIDYDSTNYLLELEDEFVMLQAYNYNWNVIAE